MATQNTIYMHIRGLGSGDALREVAEELLGVEGVRDVELEESTDSLTPPDCQRVRVELVEGVEVTRDDLLKAVAQAGASVDEFNMPAGR